jgi:hypothetical protein
MPERKNCECPVSARVKSFNILGGFIASFGALSTIFMFWWLQANYSVFWTAKSISRKEQIGKASLSRLTGDKETYWNKPASIVLFVIAIAALICSSIGASSNVIGDEEKDLKKRVMLFIPVLFSSILILCTTIVATWNSTANIKHLPFLIICTTAMVTLSVFIFILAFV